MSQSTSRSNTPPRPAHSSQLSTPPATPNVLVSKHIPLVVSMHLYNIFPLFEEATTRQQPHLERTHRTWYRPEHSKNLLYTVQLEIVVTHHHVLYHAVDDSGKTCLHWQHINESISADHLSVQDYGAMTARFSLIPKKKDPQQSVPQCNPDDSLAADRHEPHNVNVTTDPHVFLQVPIHPSKLSRIDSVPNILPVNAIVLVFSDGTLRVPHALYQLLEQNKPVVSAASAALGVLGSPLSPQHHHHHHHQPPRGFVMASMDQASASQFSSSSAPTKKTKSRDNEPFSRFGDDVFRALDQVQSPTCTRNNSFVEPIAATKSLDEIVEGKEAKHNDHPALLSRSVSSDDVHLQHDYDTPKIKADDAVVTPETQATIQDLQEEQAQLEKLLEKEELDLNHAIIDLQKIKEPIAGSIRKLTQLQEQNTQVETETGLVRMQADKAAFVLEAQRIRLFRELRTIYPVTLESDRQKYRIRGLEIPGDIYATMVSDDELAASMGYLCHLITMMSKYLSVPLRYRLFYHSSRSAVQNEHGANFPLFPGRNVEREQFGYGFRLLVRDVECICKERNIRISPKLHVLAKVKRIYESVIDGY